MVIDDAVLLKTSCLKYTTLCPWRTCTAWLTAMAPVWLQALCGGREPMPWQPLTTFGGFLNHGGTPNHPSHSAIILFKPIVTWEYLHFRKPPFEGTSVQKPSYFLITELGTCAPRYWHPMFRVDVGAPSGSEHTPPQHRRTMRRRCTGT